MNIVIQEAQPSDAAFLAWAIVTAGRAHLGRGIWDVVLDATEEDTLSLLQKLAVSERRHLFHQSCFLLAHMDGRPVGALSGHDPSKLGYPALRAALEEVLRKPGVKQLEPRISERTNQVLATIPEPVEGAWVIDSAATLPAYRRQGIMDRLLTAILEKGREQDFTTAQLSIYIGNLPAKCSYEKQGFLLLDEFRDPVFEEEIGSPGMARFVRDL